MTADSSQAKLPVLVAGAGPTGLALAIELTRHGIPVRVIDKLLTPSDKSKALGVHARTMELFENTGVAESFIEHGQKITHLSVYSENKPIAHVDFKDLDSPYPFVISLPQPVTEQILKDKLAELGVQVERPLAITSATQTADCVTAMIENTVNGTTEAIDCQWLVSCEGAHSTVRHGLNAAFEGDDYEEVFLLADVRLDCPPNCPVDDQFNLFDHHGGLSGFFRIPGNHRYRFIASLAPDNALAQKKEPSIEEVQALIDERCPAGIRVSDPLWLTTFSIRYRQVKEYRYGRIFLAGDAAHVHSPAGGQGMNTGIQDAYNLAWKLAFVVNGEADQELLNSYQSERHTVARAVIEGSDMLTRVNLLSNPIAREVRNRVAPILLAQDAVQSLIRRRVSEIAIDYRKSPIIIEHVHSHAVSDAMHITDRLLGKPVFAHHLKAGTRAADAQLRTAESGLPSRIFEALQGTTHTLLLFGGVDFDNQKLEQLEAIAAAASQSHGKLLKTVLIIGGDTLPQDCKFPGRVFLDPAYNSHSIYGATKASLYLVRPDWYIGLASEPPSAEDVINYFQQLLSGRQPSKTHA